MLQTTLIALLVNVERESMIMDHNVRMIYIGNFKTRLWLLPRDLVSSGGA